MSGNHLRQFFYLLAFLPAAYSEIKPITALLEPDSSHIQYVEGYLRTPGFIDLSDLSFSTVGTGEFIVDDDHFKEGNMMDDDGGSRRLENELPRRDEAGNFAVEGSSLDIVVFHLPSDCASSKDGCDWVSLGIGARSQEGVLRYCCSQDAIDMKMCTGANWGRLIIDIDRFKGKHRLMNIPDTGDFNSHLKFGRFEEKDADSSGIYTIAFANCNVEGRPVIVEGETVWKSRHGYLPGDKFGWMYFSAFLFVFYISLLLWYGVSMKMFEDAKIPLQAWIFATIGIGCVEVFFATANLFIWNQEGKQFVAAHYIGDIVGILKQGMSRCLLVMVSLGWGVTRDDLGPIMSRINFLGGLYILISLVVEFMTDFVRSEVQKLSEEEEGELFDITMILSLVISLIDSVFYLWILDSLNATMEELESANQTLKLKRYMRLRLILLISILFAVATVVFAIVDSRAEGIVEGDQKWFLNAAVASNYLFVLTAVAILWRPQQNAKDYAFVMQLPTIKTDEEEGEFEMSATVPSAADLSDDDEGGDEAMFNDEPEK